MVRGSQAEPLAGTMVVLHRIGRSVQGPLDSMATDRRGRFTFRFRPDSASLYIVTARYQGIEYFSNPVATTPATADTGLALQVFDTSASAPVHTEARHIVIAKPGADGTRTVVELIVVDNPGERTRVARDSQSSTWHALIPPQAAGFSAEDGDLSAGAVDRNRDSILVLAPLAPGERQISVQYHLPANAGHLVYPFDERVSGVNVLVEEPDATVRGGNLQPTDSVTVIQGRPFRHFNGVVDSGDVVLVTVPVPFRLARGWLVVPVALLAVAVIVTLVRVFRAPAPPSVAAPDAPGAAAAALVGDLAALDDQLARLDLDAGAERARLQRRREELKRELAEALARSGGRA